MKYGIFDITGTNKFYYFDADSNTEREELINSSSYIPALLIKPDKNSDVRSPYLYDKEKPIVDDIIKINIVNSKREYSINKSCVRSKTRMLLGLFNKIRNQGSEKYGAELAIDEDNSQNEVLEDFKTWASEVVRSKKTVESKIIPVPDNFPSSVQDIVINDFGSSNSVFLLWNSVASVLGLDKQLKDYDLKDGDKILVIDSNDLGQVYSVIEMKTCKKDGRLIPSHSIYYNVDSIATSSNAPSHYEEWYLNDDPNYDSYYVDDCEIELIVDNLSSENQLQFNRLMLNEGEYEEYTQPESIIESARISFINTFYANLHTNNQGYLQVIRPNHDSFTTNTLTRSKCTVIAPHIKNECLEDTHENLALEYMNMSDQVIEILR